MAVYPYVVRVKANQFRKDSQNNFRIGESTAFYTGKGNWAQRLNIKLRKYTESDRNLRLGFLSYLLTRDIASTKDLTIAEARALIALDLTNAFAEYQRDIPHGS